MTIEFPPNTSIDRSALAVLASLPVFNDLDPGTLVAVADQLEWFCLPSGTVLFEQGETADSLYAVTSGALGAWRRDASGHSQMIGRIQRGETVGEGALLSGGLRTATVKSIRDAELVRFSKQAFDELVQVYPSAMLHIARLALRRLELSQRAGNPRPASRSFAVLCSGPVADARAFAQSLELALGRFGKTELFTRGSVEQHTSAWFNEIEARRDYVIFVADADASPWTRQCIGQADTLILLVDAKDEPAPLLDLALAGHEVADSQQVELVIQHRRVVRPGVAKRWLALCPAAQHHHLRTVDDVHRLARLLTGNAVGLSAPRPPERGRLASHRRDPEPRRHAARPPAPSLSDAHRVGHLRPDARRHLPRTRQPAVLGPPGDRHRAHRTQLARLSAREPDRGNGLDRAPARRRRERLRAREVELVGEPHRQ
jgi:NTE family protein